MIVGLTGRKGHGKDVVGNLLCIGFGFRRLAFADPLKVVARQLFDLADEQVNGTLAQKEAIDPRWGLSPREIMQRLGTEVGRSIHPEVWTRAALRTIDRSPTVSWVVTDCRFPNEAAAIRSRGGFVVRVLRPGFSTGTSEAHDSERMVDLVEADAVVLNDGPLEAMPAKVHALVDELRRHA